MKLASICAINPKANSILENMQVSFVSMADVSENGEISTDTVRYYDEVKSGFTCFAEGDVLFAKITPCMENGKGAIAIGLRNGVGFGSTEFHVLRPNPEVLDRRWLYYLTIWPVFRKEAERHMTGSAGQKRVPKSFLENYEITLPPLFQQKKQSEMLDRVKEIIGKLTKELALYDELVKARFVEMFGDPVVGDKIHGNLHKVGEFASVTKLAGFEFTKYIQYRESGDIIMLRGLNCKSGRLVLDDIKWIDQETSDLLPRSKLFYGDILMTYAGTIGEVAMVDADNKYHLAPNVGKITIEDKEHYDPVYLMYLFMFSHDYIMTFASQVAQASINMEKIRNFEYYFPSIDEQREFTAFVSQVDKSKVVVEKALDEAQMLFDSLMQKYFG